MSDVLDECKRRFGISFSEVGTGGGCCALEARLESGHWIVATDEGLCSFQERLGLEADHDHVNMGWSIGIYENGTDHGCDWWGGGESIVDVTDLDARAEKLPDLVGKALAELMGVAKSNGGDR